MLKSTIRPDAIVRNIFIGKCLYSSAPVGFPASSEFYFKDIVKTVYSKKPLEPSSPTRNVNALLGSLKQSKSTDDLSMLSDTYLRLEPENQKKTIAKLKADPNLLPLYPRIYCSIIGNMIEAEKFEELTEFHEAAFLPDKAFSRQIILAVLKLGIAKSSESAKCMKQLYLHTPRGAIGDVFDDLVPWLHASGVNTKRVLSIMCFLISKGDFPQTSKSYNLLTALVKDDSKINSSSSVNLLLRKIPQCIKSGNVVPYKLLKNTIKLSAEMPGPRFKKLCVLTDTIIASGYRHILDDKFWKSVIQFHTRTPVSQIMLYMKENGFETEKNEIYQGILMRQTTPEKFNRAVHIVKEKELKVTPRALGHLMFVHTCHDSFKAKQIFEHLLESEPLESHSQIVFGYIKGLFHARKYNAILQMNELFLSSHDVQIWNYLLSAAEKSRRAIKAKWIVNQMLEKDIPLKPRQVAEYILCLLEHGRKQRGTRESYVSRPLQIASSKTSLPPQYEPLSIEDILREIEKLQKQSYVYPKSCLDQLIKTLDEINISKKELLMALDSLSQGWAKEASYSWSGSNGSMVFINSFSPVRVFSPEHIQKLVYFGFKKSPREPWSSIEIFRMLKLRGIEIDKEAIMVGFSEIIRKLYGHSPLSGELKRIHHQSDPNMTMRDLITRINQEWNDTIVNF